MEKVIVQQISDFLERNLIISDVQHGFRKGRSTATALAQFTDRVNVSLNKGQQVIVLFIDFKKAFDTLDHDLLLQAMEECGVRGPINKWFDSYLKGRSMRTVVNGTAGAEAVISSGVPTGSVFGPVGYTMHVNSVSNVIEECGVNMYADDMCLMYSDNDITVIQEKIQKDFENIIKWAHDNGIIINLLKTKCMHICSPYNKKAKAVEAVNITGHTYECLHNNKTACKCQKLEVVDRYKYLGVVVDRHMSWRLHVDEVCNRLRSVLGRLYHLSHALSRRTLRVVYHALADSLLSYGLTSYGLTFKTYLDEIRQLQIRCLKYIVSEKTKSECNKDYDKLFSLCKILPVHSKVDFLLSIEQYLCDDHKILVTNKYNTKSVREGKYVQPGKINYYGERTRAYVTPRIFNRIDILRDDDRFTLPVLKYKLRKFLLEDCIQ